VSASILVCDDEAGLREMLTVLLRRAAYEVEAVETATDAQAALRARAFDAVVTDLALPDGSGMDVLRTARSLDPALQVVMITAFGTTEQAVEAMRLGAYDYIQKPFRNHELLALLAKALEKRDIVDQNRILRQELGDVHRRGAIVGKSVAMQQVMGLVDRVADARTSVLITGESGTGKELVARAIHERGGRKDAPFVVVNCGALPEALMESELFGHERGAFTGAHQRSEGLVRRAGGGTLFLDEIGELPLPLQVKLLRLLQEWTVRPVGGSEEIAVDVRVVAATNQDLEERVAAGAFRQDLFYRLNVIRLRLPSLRERPEDIGLLAEHFLRKHGALAGRSRLRFGEEARRWLLAQPYDGNVRELENVVERAVTLARGPVVEVPDLTELTAAPPSAGLTLPKIEAGFDLDAYLGGIEHRVLLQALAETGGVRKKAAALLGMTFRSFRYRLAKYEGDADDS
jgi:two-component system response regulator PilR (NtrC family)